MDTTTTPPNPAIRQLRWRLFAFGAVAALGFGTLAACADDDSDTPGTTTTLVPGGDVEVDPSDPDGVTDDLGDLTDDMGDGAEDMGDAVEDGTDELGDDTP